MSAPVSKPEHTISVRDLVEFVLQQGDLGGEREFVGSDTPNTTATLAADNVPSGPKSLVASASTRCISSGSLGLSGHRSLWILQLSLSCSWVVSVLKVPSQRGQIRCSSLQGSQAATNSSSTLHLGHFFMAGHYQVPSSACLLACANSVLISPARSRSKGRRPPNCCRGSRK